MSLLLVYDFGVDLSGSYVFVGEHLADGVDVGSAAEEQGSVGVTALVEYTRQSKEKRIGENKT